MLRLNQIICKYYIHHYTQPPWKQSTPKRNHLLERETLLDGSWGNRGKKQELPTERYRIRQDHGSRQRRQNEYYGDEQERSGRKVSESRQERRRSRRYSGSYDESDQERQAPRRSSRYGAYSDDEDYRRGKTKLDKSKQKRRDRPERKKHGPTHIDDFEEDDLSGFDSGTETESYSSSDYSDSETSESEDRDRKGRRRFRSSASASELTNASWALGEGDVSVDRQIKAQQTEIRKQLSSLAELQKGMGLKSLPSLQQQILQQDLQKLEQLQSRLSNKPGNQSLQMQLLGQQMLLCEHLKEAEQLLSRNVAPSLVHSQSAQSLKLQMLQQQQQAIAEQQRQILLDQHRQFELEQQHQLLLAAEQQRQALLAEQQRQMQMAQLASLQPHQPFYGGLAGMQIYSPYSTAVGYY